MAKECKEKIDYKFIKWIWNYNKRNRPKIVELLDRAKEKKQIYIFKNPTELKRYLSPFNIKESY